MLQEIDIYDILPGVEVASCMDQPIGHRVTVCLKQLDQLLEEKMRQDHAFTQTASLRQQCPPQAVDLARRLVTEQVRSWCASQTIGLSTKANILRLVVWWRMYPAVGPTLDAGTVLCSRKATTSCSRRASLHNESHMGVLSAHAATVHRYNRQESLQ